MHISKFFTYHWLIDKNEALTEHNTLITFCIIIKKIERVHLCSHPLGNWRTTIIFKEYKHCYIKNKQCDFVWYLKRERFSDNLIRGLLRIRHKKIFSLEKRGRFTHTKLVSFFYTHAKKAKLRQMVKYIVNYFA